MEIRDAVLGWKIVRVGDRVRLESEAEGRVVCDFDHDEHAADFARSEWQYLEKGILVETEQLGLIHLPEDDAGLELIQRGSGSE
jgi:hypothetical protein